MPKYKVTDPESGKSLSLTGDSPPTEEELTQVFSQYKQPEQQLEQSIQQSPQQGWTSLPNREVTDIRIANRPNAYQTLGEEVQHQMSPQGFNPVASQFGPLTLGLKTLGAANQAIEAPIANAALAFQRGAGVAEIGREALKGILGQKRGELGDVIRTTGLGGTFNEPLAATAGFLASMGAINAVTKGLLTKASKTFGELAKSKAPEIMTDDWLIKQSNDLYSVADDTIKAVQTEGRNLYANLANQSIKNPKKLQGIIDDLFGGVKKEAQAVGEEINLQSVIDDIGKGLSEDNSVNVSNAKKVVDVIQNYIPKAAWTKGKKGMKATPNQQKLMKAYFGLKDVISESLDDVERVALEQFDKKASEVYRVGNAIKGLVFDSETKQATNTAQLVKIFKGDPSQAGKRRLVSMMEGLNNETSNVIRNMNKFNTRQTLKRRILYSGMAAAGLGALTLLSRKAVKKLGIQ